MEREGDTGVFEIEKATFWAQKQPMVNHFYFSFGEHLYYRIYTNNHI